MSTCSRTAKKLIRTLDLDDPSDATVFGSKKYSIHVELWLCHSTY